MILYSEDKIQMHEWLVSAIDLHEVNYLFLYFSPCILEHKVAPYTCTVIILVIMASIAMGFAYYAEIKSQKKTLVYTSEESIL